MLFNVTDKWDLNKPSFTFYSEDHYSNKFNYIDTWRMSDEVFDLSESGSQFSFSFLHTTNKSALEKYRQEDLMSDQAANYMFSELSENLRVLEMKEKGLLEWIILSNLEKETLNLT